MFPVLSEFNLSPQDQLPKHRADHLCIRCKVNAEKLAVCERFS